ncbi:hypothetical protein V3595_12985 [Bacillus sp. CFBP9009]|jgi:hypothetical protein
MKKAEALFDASAFFCFKFGKLNFFIGLRHSNNLHFYENEL